MSDVPRVEIAPIARVAGGRAATDQDLVAVEAPLEVVLAHPDDSARHSIGLLMRTPGDDADLIRGLLVGEQIIASAADIVDITFAPEGAATDDTPADPPRAHVVVSPSIDLSALAARRVLDRTSACGLCGRLSMQAVQRAGARRTDDAPAIRAEAIAGIPSRLRGGQAVFAETGGLHAAALCDLDGEPWLVREDVGRHNAVDKVIGAAMAVGRFPAADALLAVSGRVAYEIVQKASAAGVVGIVAVGAPSSLAVEAARAAGLTLAGFVRDGRFNIYSGRNRVRTT
jgi:FdhD protein